MSAEQVPVLIVGGGGAGLRLRCCVEARGRSSAGQRPSWHVRPSQGARAEPARDGDPRRLRGRRCDRAQPRSSHGFAWAGRTWRGGFSSCSMAWERACILATCVGTMRRQLERCIDYARTRKQFGQPIGKFQSVANRIVDMKLRYETARLMIYKVGWLMEENKSTDMDAAMAKLYVSESFVKSCLDAVQIHGGSGFMTELEFERELRDRSGARCIRHFGDSAEYYRARAADLNGFFRSIIATVMGPAQAERAMGIILAGLATAGFNRSRGRLFSFFQRSRISCYDTSGRCRYSCCGRMDKEIRHSRSC